MERLALHVHYAAVEKTRERQSAERDKGPATPGDSARSARRDLPRLAPVDGPGACDSLQTICRTSSIPQKLYSPRKRTRTHWLGSVCHRGLRGRQCRLWKAAGSGLGRFRQPRAG